MAKARKDNKGRALRKGECQRKSDNSYVYTYTDPFGKRRYVYASDLKELREKEKKLLKDQLDGLDTYKAEKVTLNFVFDKYIESKCDVRESSLGNYRYLYNLRVRDGFGTRKIADIKYSDVKYFYNHLMNECQLSLSSLDNIHTILHPTFELAVRDNIIRNNPANGVMAEIKRRAGKSKSPRHALTLEQQRAFMNYVENSLVYNQWFPLFTTLFGTGCRIGEIIGLRWEDLDFDERIISINHNMAYLAREEKSAYYKVELPKTDSGIRTIPMLDEVYDVLKAEYERQKKAGFNSLVIDGMTGFIFCNKSGKICRPPSINYTIKKIIELYNEMETSNAAGEAREPLIIPNFTCHHMRHTFCTRLCESETNVKVIQDVMGHASIETTMNIYAEVTNQKKQEAFKILSDKSGVF